MQVHCTCNSLAKADLLNYGSAQKAPAQGAGDDYPNNRIEVNVTKWSVLFFFVVFAVVPTATSHPLKATASLVEYDPKAKTLAVECKVFRDDFQGSLSNSTLKDIDPETLTKADKKKIIEDHFRKHYIINHNGKTVPLELESSKYLREYNVLVMRFKPQALSLRKGDKLFIKNTLFFDDFGYMQSNRVVVRIPSFSIDNHHIATVAQKHFSYTL